VEPRCLSKSRQSLCQLLGYLCVNIRKAPLPPGRDSQMLRSRAADSTTYTAMCVVALRWSGGAHWAGSKMPQPPLTPLYSQSTSTSVLYIDVINGILFSSFIDL